MRKRNIALIGFRATGKSTVGQILAADLEMEFVDMDKRLTLEAGRTIRTWVEEEGWESFRRAESNLLGIIRWMTGVVVATGGGIVLDPESRQLLREHFFTVRLKASPETIHTRLTADPESTAARPPLSKLSLMDEIVHVLSERDVLYTEASAMQIDTEGRQPRSVAQEIMAAYGQGRS